MAKAPRVVTKPQWEAEVARRERILEELRRLSGLPIPDRPWRYDYSLDEVYQIIYGVLDLYRGKGDLDPAVRQVVQGGFR